MAVQQYLWIGHNGEPRSSISSAEGVQGKGVI